MKKRGFTLAELLIVLGIAGVVAAVILPAINGLMPDKTKINYLKVYDELGNNIKSMVADTLLFPILLKEGSTDIDVSRYPLVNNSQPLKAPFKDDTKYSGDNKLCNLLAHTFGADSCNTTSYPDKSSFTTSNGMEWWISQTKREIDTAENKISYQTDIYVDVDSSKESSNCMYGEDGCKNPDRFKFLLAADGRLVPADPVGVHYINTKKNLLKKKFDVEGNVLASLDDKMFEDDPGEETPSTPTPNPTPTPTPTPEPDPEPDIPVYVPEPEPVEELDPCESRFKWNGGGPLYMQCLSHPSIYPDRNANFGKVMKSSDFTKDINEYWSQLTEPAATTVTVSIYIDRVRVFHRDAAAYVALGTTNCYYRPGVSVSGFCVNRYAAAVPAWSSPFATCTYRAGSRMCDMSIAYNPFQSLPGNVDNCEAYPSKADCTYDSSSFDLSIADISPRYDSTNIYYSYDWGGYNVYPSTVYSWLTNGGSGSGEFIK